jgi:hypothetical protein
MPWMFGLAHGVTRVLGSGTSRGAVAAGSASPRDDGAYLTDGRRLFRVVWPLCSLERPDMAILEDCGTLCLTAFTSAELSLMRLTPVIPSGRR